MGILVSRLGGKELQPRNLPLAGKTAALSFRVDPVQPGRPDLRFPGAGDPVQDLPVDPGGVPAPFEPPVHHRRSAADHLFFPFSFNVKNGSPIFSSRSLWIPTPVSITSI